MYICMSVFVFFLFTSAFVGINIIIDVFCLRYISTAQNWTNSLVEIGCHLDVNVMLCTISLYTVRQQLHRL